MFINYLVTALRAFKQQKQHFLLNIVGLSIGLGAAILVALFTVYESSYDNFQPQHERVFRVSQTFNTLGVSAPISNKDALMTMRDLPAIEDILSLGMVPPGDEYKVDGVGFKLEGVLSASLNILEFMQIDVLHGQLKEALLQPNHIALSRSYALRLFGQEQAVGKTMQRGDKRWTVAAVFTDLPENTHFAFNALIKESAPSTSYSSNSGYNYLRVTAGTDIATLNKSIEDRYLRLAFPEHKDMVSLSLQALTDIHLTSDSRYEMKENGSQTTVYICIGLSVLLIALASFNFINMSIAQAARRAKEVGVRKALGASRGQIVTQFLLESVLITLLAGVIACMLVEVSLPIFNQLIDRQLVMNYQSLFAALVMGVVLLIGLLAGVYPALFMSAFSAKRVLSGDLQRGHTAILIRKALLVLQSALSVALIIGAMLLQQQLSYLQTLPVGYEKTAKLQISDIDAGDLFYQQNNALLNQVNNINGVEHVGVIDISLTDSFNSSLSFTADNGQFSEQILPFIGVGMNAIPSIGLTLIAGRDFSQQTSADWYALDDNQQASASVILTESLVKQAGYSSPEAALGRIWKTQDGRNNLMVLKIVGVVKDIKVGTVRDQQPATLFICGYTNSWTGRMLLDIDMTQLSAIKAQLSQVLGKSLNIFAPKIELVSENYKAIYRNDERTAKLVSVFSALAVFLACMGTFGLASFSVLRRQKEVAVRKVLGASRISIMNLLAKEFLILVVISVAIAYPLTFWLVGDWLANFNERVDQAFWVYGMAALVVAVITWLTVATIAFKAASARPSLTLRYE
ncbi:FtsX-like permease family protein [Pseudoalteromonas sp. NEC-BIFX-2020_015]|uniref:ABC transporter permease n=1 Tax=Pseudoalteromonas sp. NEC-BIFX-2020_015 TaxID=2729544 RepID=UPI0014614098|nr:ABC transporter permease [Pseudoalteromonas sp. NEC-BIFX-2020_015]NMR24722.1 FtsX-like permease family protein [Pseudoalteromonas sp. NEC-BIFX-2020_015]